MLHEVQRPLRVFLCHASIDKPAVYHLYQRLIAEGVDVWLDESKLLPGQDWRLEIPKAVSSSDVVIICLSNNSISKEGYVQKEIKLALDAADEKPEETIFLIPTRLENCTVPVRLSKYQWVDLFIPHGHEKILKSLQIRANSLGLKSDITHRQITSDDPKFTDSLLKIGGMDFVSIPAGNFLMGSKNQVNFTLTGEQPQHMLEISYDYFISKTPITNIQYRQYIKAKDDIGFYVNPKKENHPVVNINWYEAQDYVNWLNATFEETLPLSFRFRLPSEAEWEKAARGQNGNEWPWSNEWHPNCCNSLEKGLKDTSPVGMFSPYGDSPYGVADMVGNVWEWTRSLFKNYPYRSSDGREDEEIVGDRTVRGGSYKNRFL